MQKTKVIKFIGIFLILFAISTNPITFGHYFGGADKTINSRSINLMILFFESFIFIIGIYFLLKPLVVANNNLVINLILLFTSILVILFLIESISFLIINFSDNSRLVEDGEIIEISTPSLPTEKDDDFGWMLKKNYHGNAYKAYSNGKVIYNASYSIDQYRRRRVNQKYIQNNSHLILFGGSYTFGRGLNDKGTLQYMFKEGLPGYNIYNYGVSGYGPHQTLALLEGERLPLEGDSKRGLAIYIFIRHHIHRAIGDTSTSWGYNSPFYYLDKNGQLQRKGSFHSGRPTKTKIYRVFLRVKEKSNFLKLIDLNFPLKISESDVRLTYEILAESKKRYEEKFNGTFFVLIHPLPHQDENTKHLIKLLEENNINILDYPIENPDQYEILPGVDNHPNAKFNKFLSDKLIPELKIRNGK
ncbi:MAG: hypothetical protein ACW99L_15825 [Promethearchaeota archaeon]|jgi:hypothetical protein